MPALLASVVLAHCQTCLNALRHQHAQGTEELVGGVQRLRAQIRRCDDVRELSTARLVRPFVALVRSPAASGPVTSAALAAVHSTVTLGFIALDSPEAEDAVAEIADGVASCQFQQTAADGDEVVMMQVLQLAVALFEAPAGALLTEHAAWSLLEALYEVTGDPLHSTLLRCHAERSLWACINVVFSQLPHLIAREARGEVLSPPPRARRRSVAECVSYGRLCSVKLVARLCAGVVGADGDAGGAGDASPRPSGDGDGGGGDDGEGRHRRDLTRPRACLGLLLQVVHAGGAAMARCPAILGLVQDDVCRAVMAAVTTARQVRSVQLLSTALQTLAALWRNLRTELKIQSHALLEAVVLFALDPARPVPPDDPNASRFVEVERELVLELVADLSAHPGFLADVFVNYDCDPQQSDLLEDLAGLLSRLVSEPPPTASRGARQAALDVLLRWLQWVATREAALSTPPAAAAYAAGGALEALSPEALGQRKATKRLLAQAAALFNSKPREGLQLLQTHNVLADMTDPAEVVAFLRGTPFLDKAAVGSFLGELGKRADDADAHPVDVEDFREAVRRSFMESFDLEAKSTALLDALRLVLSAFRLPGEAQQIDRILQCFAEYAHQHCSDAALMATPDVAYLLSFSIIMLNTDLHNPNIRPDKRMQLSDFIRNNTNYGHEVSAGTDLPEYLLTGIYESVRDHPFSIGAQGDIAVDKWRDLLLKAATQERLVVHEHGWVGYLPDESPQDHHQEHPQKMPAGAYDRQLFALLYKPALQAAMGVFTDPAPADKLPSAAVDAFLLLGKVASRFEDSRKLDHVVAVLCQLTTLQRAPPRADAQQLVTDPTSLALQHFCRSQGAQLAAVAAFGIAHKFGAQLRKGWSPIFRCVLRLYDLQLLPPAMLRESDEDLFEQPAQRAAFNAHAKTLYRGAAQPKPLHRRASSGAGGLLGYFWGSQDSGAPEGGSEQGQGLGHDPDQGGGDDEEEEDDGYLHVRRPVRAYGEKLREVALQRLRSCRVADVVNETKYLPNEALSSVAAALLTLCPSRDGAAPTAAAAAGGGEGEGEGEGETKAETKAETHPEAGGVLSPFARVYAQQLVVELVLRNRDRARLLWPPVAEVLVGILEHAAQPTFAAEKAAAGLLRIGARLVSRDDVRDDVVHALRLLPALREPVARPLAPLLAAGARRLLHECADAGTAAAGGAGGVGAEHWAVLLHLLDCHAEEPRAAEAAFAALRDALGDPALLACPPAVVVRPVRAFVASPLGGEPRACAAVDLLAAVHERTRQRLWAALESSPRAGGAPPVALDVDLQALLPDAGPGCETLGDVWTLTCRPLLDALAESARDGRPAVGQHALLRLQEALNDPGSKLSARRWRSLFGTLVLPLLAEVLMTVPASYQAHADATHESSSAKTRDEASLLQRSRSASHKLGLGQGVRQAAERTQVLALELLSRCFLQQLAPQLATSSFHELWLEVIAALEQFVGAEAAGVGTATVRETAVETLKNVLLVMSTMGVFEPGEHTTGTEMWQLTWAAVDPFCPALRAELFPGCDAQSPVSSVSGSAAAEVASAVAGSPPAPAPRTAADLVPPSPAVARLPRAAPVADGAQQPALALQRSYCVTHAHTFWGAHLVRGLAARGLPVRAMLPAGPDAGAVIRALEALDGGEDVRAHVVDYASDEALRVVLRRAEGVFVCPPNWATSGAPSAGPAAVELCGRLMRACQAEEVPRVVFTSSLAAVAGGSAAKSLHESDWADWTAAAALAAAWPDAAAERAAWSVAAGSATSFVALNPGVVVGAQPLPGVELPGAVGGGGVPAGVVAAGDLVAAHVAALEPVASGRYLCAAGVLTGEGLGVVLSGSAAGESGEVELAQVVCDCSRAKTELGVEFAPCW